MTNKIKYTQEDIRKIIIAASREYEKNLNGKDILFISKDMTSTCMVSFTKRNFLHFTGVATKLTPKDFYDKAINGLLSNDDFKIKNKTTFKKMDVINMAMNIHKCATMLGDFTQQGICIQADIGIGNISCTVTAGIKNNLPFGNICFPIGVVDTSIQQSVSPRVPIVAVLSKKINEKTFNTITRVSKNIKTEDLHFTKEIKAMLTDSALSQIMSKEPNIISKETPKADTKQSETISKSATVSQAISASNTKEIPRTDSKQSTQGNNKVSEIVSKANTTLQNTQNINGSTQKASFFNKALSKINPFKKQKNKNQNSKANNNVAVSSEITAQRETAAAKERKPEPPKESLESRLARAKQHSQADEAKRKVAPAKNEKDNPNR